MLTRRSKNRLSQRRESMAPTGSRATVFQRIVSSLETRGKRPGSPVKRFSAPLTRHKLAISAGGW